MPRDHSARKSLRKKSKRKKQTPANAQWPSLSKAAQRAWIVARFLQDGMKVPRAGLDGPSSALMAAGLGGLLHEAADGEKHALAGELADAVRPVLTGLREWTMMLDTLGKSPKLPVEWRVQVPRTVDELDFALALIFRELSVLVRHRARVSRNSDLLCGAVALAIGDGPEAARLVRRIHEMHLDEEEREEDGQLSDGGWAAAFARDAYRRMEPLDRLADDFPDQVGVAARRMNAWPMLWHRVSRQTRFDQIVERLKLGDEYPLETSARANPDTPMVAYLHRLIDQLHDLWVTFQDWKMGPANLRPPEADQADHIRWSWNEWPDEPPTDEVVGVLMVCRELPPLTKATADEWVDRLVIPFILMTDGRDHRKTSEPALQQIAKQNGVKSQATFASRLKPQVKRTLTSIARSA